MGPNNQEMASKGIDDSNGWVVAWASFFVKVLSQGVINIRGLFFLATISRFNTDRQQASLPFTLCVCIKNGIGPFVSCIGNRYGLRKVTLIGCIGSSIAVGACFFAESVAVLTIFWGIALGIFFGFSNTLIPVILNEHFEKHRVKANGLNIAGSSFGLLALSPVVDFLIGTYGLSGTFLITAGLMLNSVPAALIMLYKQQNSSFIEKRKTPYIDTLSKCSVISIGNRGTSTTSLKCVEPLLQAHPLSDKKCKFSRVENSSVGCNPMMEGGCRGSFSEIETPEGLNTIEPFDQIQYELCEICQSTSLRCQCNTTTVSVEQSSLNTDAASGLPMGQVHSDWQTDEQREFHGEKLGEKIKNSAGCLRQDGTDNESSAIPETISFLNASEQMQENERKVTISFVDKKSWKRPVTNSISVETRHATNKESFGKTGLLHFLTHSDIFLLLCDWKFLIFAIGGGGYAFMLATFLLIIADFAIDQDMHPSNVKYLIMWISVADILGRLCLGWVTDIGYISKKNFIGLCFACSCVSNLGAVWSSGNVTLLISVTLFVLAQCGIILNLHPVIAEFIKKDLQTTAISSSFVLGAPMVFVISPMIGFFRDGMKSYSGIFYALSALNFICASLFLCVPMSPASD